ncbi:MAG: 7-carboxy-7-deazaguanine synthase QueE [Elusimicrobia bacterium]|nr:7-carboxy-7-deazaguanine synthase QueE [Elusimicrobiota bacterium]
MSEATPLTPTPRLRSGQALSPHRGERIQVVAVPVLEIFSTLQGEGLYAGERQIFLRFGGCNLHCDYCDTPESIPMGSGRPMRVEAILEAVDRLQAEQRHVSLSFTGGEPLLHADTLDLLISPIKARGLRIYLETNGTLPHALARIIARCDVVAMDMKLPSACGPAFWKLHEAFLRVGLGKTFVKVVVTDRTQLWEIERVVTLIAQSDPTVPLVIQPATPFNGIAPAPWESIMTWEQLARCQLRDVRIIPQLHRLWGLP